MRSCKEPIAQVKYYVVEVKLATVEEGAEVKAAVYPRVTCGAVAWRLAALIRVVACWLRCYNGKSAYVLFLRKVYFKY